MKRHRAGTARYPGDVSTIAGEVKGPTTFGSFVLAHAAVYDRDVDATFVEFRTCDPADEVVADEHGIMRLVGS